jgi:hypothetical protein
MLNQGVDKILTIKMIAALLLKKIREMRDFFDEVGRTRIFVRGVL